MPELIAKEDAHYWPEIRQESRRVQRSPRNPTARWSRGETAAARGKREGWASMCSTIHPKDIPSWNPSMHVVACFSVYSGVTNHAQSSLILPVTVSDLRERKGKFCEQMCRGLVERKIVVSRPPRLQLARK